MRTFRIEVGRSHKVQAGNIVGAIANEAGISSDSIGRIKIFDLYSTVDLPAAIPAELLNLLKNVSVAGRKLQISPTDEFRPRPVRRQNGKRPLNKSQAKKHRQRGAASP